MLLQKYSHEPFIFSGLVRVSSLVDSPPDARKNTDVARHKAMLKRIVLF